MVIDLLPARPERAARPSGSSCTPSPGAIKRARAQAAPCIAAAQAAPARSTSMVEDIKTSIASQVDFLLLVGKLKVGDALPVFCR